LFTQRIRIEEGADPFQSMYFFQQLVAPIGTGTAYTCVALQIYHQTWPLSNFPPPPHLEMFHLPDGSHGHARAGGDRATPPDVNFVGQRHQQSWREPAPSHFETVSALEVPAEPPASSLCAAM
jgi:hypothetical protein